MRVMTVQEGEPRASVAYESWSAWRTRQCIDPSAPSAPLGSCFCATCWGAGRYMEPARNGEGLIPVPCPSCCGTGAIPSTGLR